MRRATTSSPSTSARRWCSASATPSRAVHADATDRETLEALGLQDVDCAIISVGERIDNSILIALHLAEMGVQKIVVKAVNDTHGKITPEDRRHRGGLPRRRWPSARPTATATRTCWTQISLGDDVTILGPEAAPAFLVGKSILKDASCGRITC